MAGIPKGKERLCLLGYLDVSPADGFTAAFDCRTTRRGRQFGDPLLPRQHGALVVNCLWFLPLGFPRGEAAERSEADEGRRWLKVSDFPVEWRKPKHMPFIQLHSLTNLSPPLISLFCQSVPKCRLPKIPASPRGKPRTQKPLDITIQRTAQLRRRRVAKLATPTRAVQDHEHIPLIVVHPLSQPVRADSI